MPLSLIRRYSIYLAFVGHKCLMVGHKLLVIGPRPNLGYATEETIVDTVFLSLGSSKEGTWLFLNLVGKVTSRVQNT